MNTSSIGIIGYGSFGVFIHTLVQKHFPNISVRIFSRSHTVDSQTFFSFEETCASDLLFICVPISHFEETITRTLPHLSPKTVVCDVATVKVHTVQVLKTLGVPRYIATHPMFGPYSYAKQGNSLKHLRIAVCNSSLSDTEQQAILSFLTQAEFTVLTLTAEEHDKLVAETLFLTHLVGQTVHSGGFERTAIDTVSFGFLMDAVESVAHDEALFHDVYRYDPYCKEVLERFEKAQSAVKGKLEM